MRWTRTLLVSIALVLATSFAMAKGVYLSPQEFLQQSFGSFSQGSQALWLDDADKQQDKAIFHRDYVGFRVRYWQDGQKTAWILNDIGKTRPITFGVVVTGDQIENVTVLEFRESRGGEIRHPFFTKQFAGLKLAGEGADLSDSVDGITGATLSVRAATRVARFALYLSTRVTSNTQARLDE